jgi:glycine cleavage system protein P-like pyridoxal-binding family
VLDRFCDALISIREEIAEMRKEKLISTTTSLR